MSSKPTKRKRTDLGALRMHAGATNEFRYLEFYAGVGGWRMALNEALQKKEFSSTEIDATRCVAALDHSDLCLQVYDHNFPSEKIAKPCRIEKIKTNQMTNEWRADAWFMSPPCQPHTRQHDNQSNDLTDPRSSSFLHLCKLLEEEIPDETLPEMICLENVVGFAESNSCAIWRRALSKRGYAVAHFHWNPTQVNLPNDRPRYFCLAVRRCRMVACPRLQSVVSDEDIGRDPVIQTSLKELLVMEDSKESQSSLPRIGEFLDQESQASHHVHVPDKLLERNASWCFDIVTADSQRSACFTSGYGKFVKGTGSVLYTGPHVSKGNESESNPFALQRPEDREFDGDWSKSLEPKSLRYLSGSEIARLMGFAPSFSFPDSCSAKQQWKLVGNSLNVRLASKLITLGLCLCGKLRLENGEESN